MTYDASTKTYQINHFANDPASCYNPECSNWEKYYGPDDFLSAGGGTNKIKGCKMFMFKIRQNKTEGDCMLMDETFENGFKSSAKMRQNNRLLHVGLRECKQSKHPEEWCTNCNEGSYYISRIYYFDHYSM